MFIITLSITCDLPIITFCTSAESACEIAPTAFNRSLTSGVLWCFGCAGATGAAGAAGIAGAGATGAAGAAGIGGAGIGGAGIPGAGIPGAGGVCCIFFPPFFSFTPSTDGSH